MNYWLVKTEPGDYSYNDLVQKGRDRWNGVRNRLAQKHLQSMKLGDGVLVYHTGKEKAIVGMAEVVSEPYPETEAPGYATVEMAPRYALKRKVTLQEIKANPIFRDWELVRLPRLSVMPAPKEYWNFIHQLAETSR
ncbi:MAG TPA: EVE domain-containing protein [Bacillota bacterium]|nr:EVE domain-containing protein [Bacillota bacterium]